METSAVAFFIIWITLAFIVAYVGGQKQRSKAGFFWLSFLLSPLVGFLVAIAIPKGGNNSSRISSCPYCKEEIIVDATVCRHCKKELDPTTQQRQALDALVQKKSDDEKGRRFGPKFRGVIFLGFGIFYLVGSVVGATTIFVQNPSNLNAGILIFLIPVALFIYFGVSQLRKSKA